MVLHHVVVFTTNHIIVLEKIELSEVPEDDTHFMSKRVGQT
jgi:hypothetical protein